MAAAYSRDVALHLDLDLDLDLDTPVEVEVEHPVEITNIAPYASKANSTLHLIPQEAFERGLARLERDLAKGPIRGMRRYLFVWATR